MEDNKLKKTLASQSLLKACCCRVFSVDPGYTGNKLRTLLKNVKEPKSTGDKVDSKPKAKACSTKSKSKAGKKASK